MVYTIPVVRFVTLNGSISMNDFDVINGRGR